MRKLGQLGFVICVLAMMLFPFLFAHREDNRIAEDENRYYANFPRVWEEGKLNSEYIAEFEAWINDNARFRTLFREMRTSILYKVFGVLDLEDVRVGTDQELYGASAKAVDLVQGRNLLSEEELQYYENSLFELQQWLEEQSIGFYYMTCMDKITIMKEYYPEEVLRYDTESVGQQVEDYIEKKGRVHNVALYNILKEEADNNIYYQYIDWCHWNDAGMYLGYRQLMEKIQQEYPEVSCLQKENYTINNVSAKKNIYGFEYPLEENYLSYQITEPNAVETDTELHNELYYKEHTHYFENPSGQKRVLVINDSFVRMAMKNSLAESFQETLSVDLGNLSRIQWLVEAYQPEIVILECVEGNISSVLSMLGSIDLK